MRISDWSSDVCSSDLEPDGYTLLFSYEGFHTGSPALSTNQGWDPVKSFTPVGEVFRGPHVILVPKNAPAQTLGQLIAQAKAQPGRTEERREGKECVSKGSYRGSPYHSTKKQTD